ncbi:MAG: adenylyltransferase/cytidyltransferase family protein [Candidatus Aminicenantes bacterium]|nr:adenylyltransferase/cytidyltransferase family protein [Candidatus Aminicenantes bacterium]
MKKIFPLRELKKVISKQKNRGKTVVLVNGCFDLIHIGHIRYLKAARNMGDLLVVALNSDSSVSRLKGEGRPILNQSHRAQILSSFEFVDYVTIFSEKDVSRILLTLKPQIQAKGTDYSKETVPEKDIVHSYGGKVMIVGGPKIRSTSEIIAEIAENHHVSS